METVTTIATVRAAVARWRSAGERVGFVPTMGYLHAGHLALIEEARRRADRVVASIFVNPLQFGPNEDLSRYPRDLARDSELLTERGTDLLFTPTVDEMYPERGTVRVEPGDIAARWEGAVRPGHFAGVLTVVAKLFNQVGPDVACFGQKDIQQVTLIRRMVRELDWPIEIVTVPTVREPDGLALSSRNVYLHGDERTTARMLSRAIVAAQQAWRDGESRGEVLIAVAEAVFAGATGVSVDYVGLVDPDRLEPVVAASADSMVTVAARVGTTRLIDNASLGAAIG